MRLFILFLILTISNGIFGYNILAIWPVVSRTHFTLGMALLEKLAENGHTITLFSPFEQRLMHENIKLVKLQGATEATMHGNNLNFLEMRKLSVNEMLKSRIETGARMTEFAIKNENLKEVLMLREKFNVFIYDAYYNDALLMFPYLLGIPAIAFSCIGHNQQTLHLVRNPTNPAYNLNMLADIKNMKSISARIKNVLANLVELYHFHFTYLPMQNKILNENFANVPQNNLNMNDLIHHADLLLINSDPLIQPARANNQNSIEIGGIQIKTQQEEIHKDLYSLMDRAIYGVIYVSLGGNIQSKDLPKEKLNIFLNVFTSLKEKNIVILWKYEGIDLKEKQPHNTVIGPWMPQQEILSHKNLKAFITHGGLLSLMEAYHYAKPVIGIPIFNDQKYNMAQATNQGYGIQLDYDNLTEDILRTAIDKIFNDTSYQDNVEKISEIAKDSLTKPVDKAAWYVEYIAKTKGAKHLRTPAFMLSFCQIYFIDQMLLIVFLIITFLTTLKFLKVKLLKRNKTTKQNTTRKGKRVAIERTNKFKIK